MPPGLFHQGTVRESSARRRVDHLAPARAAFRGGHTPTAGRGGDHRFANLSSRSPKRGVALPDRSAASGALGVVGLNHGDLGKVDLGFFGEDHGQRGKDSLAHLRFIEHELGLPVGVNADPGIEGIHGIFGRSMAQMVAQGEANDQSSCGSRGSRKKCPA